MTPSAPSAVPSTWPGPITAPSATVTSPANTPTPCATPPRTSTSPRTTPLLAMRPADCTTVPGSPEGVVPRASSSPSTSTAPELPKLADVSVRPPAMLTPTPVPPAPADPLLKVALVVRSPFSTRTVPSPVLDTGGLSPAGPGTTVTTVSSVMFSAPLLASEPTTAPLTLASPALVNAPSIVPVEARLAPAAFVTASAWSVPALAMEAPEALSIRVASIRPPAATETPGSPVTPGDALVTSPSTVSALPPVRTRAASRLSRSPATVSGPVTWRTAVPVLATSPSTRP